MQQAPEPGNAAHRHRRYNRGPGGAHVEPPVLLLFPHACLFRGRRPVQGRHDPRRQRVVAADRGRVRQAPQGEGGERAAALCRRPAPRRCSPRHSAWPQSSIRSSCGTCAATTSSASRSSRRTTTAMRRHRPRRPRWRSRCTPRRCSSTSAARAAIAARRPTHCVRRSRRSSASSAKASRRRRGSTSSRHTGCRRRSGTSSGCCCTSPTSSRWNGRR